MNNLSVNTEILILSYDFAISNSLNIKEECSKLGIKAEIVSPDRLSLNISPNCSKALIDSELFTAKVIICRSINYIFPFLRSWLTICEDEGIKVLNSVEKIEDTLDKARTLTLLASNGVNIVPAVSIIGSLNSLPFPGENIIKPAFGSGGRGIEEVTLLKANSIINDANNNSPAILEHSLLQPLVKPYGMDFRSVVLAGKEIAQTKRVAVDGKITTNGVDSKVFSTNLNQISDIGVRATNALGLEFAAVDIIIYNESPSVLEVNYSPGLEFTSKVTGVNISKLLIEYLSQYL